MLGKIIKALFEPNIDVEELDPGYEIKPKPEAIVNQEKKLQENEKKVLENNIKRLEQEKENIKKTFYHYNQYFFKKCIIFNQKKSIKLQKFLIIIFHSIYNNFF